MIKSYYDYQLMYLYLNEYNEKKSSENLIVFLSDANPYMRASEDSLDMAVYIDFKNQYYEYPNHEDFSYEFICSYLKNIDYYQGIYEIFTENGKEGYVEYCNEVVENYSHFIEEPLYDIFVEYQVMYIIIESIYNDKPNDYIKSFLDEGNPFTDDGGYKIDIKPYMIFKEKYDSSENHDCSSYESVMNYLNCGEYNMIYAAMKKISKDEYKKKSFDILTKQSSRLHFGIECKYGNKIVSKEEWRKLNCCD